MDNIVLLIHFKVSNVDDIFHGEYILPLLLMLKIMIVYLVVLRCDFFFSALTSLTPNICEIRGEFEASFFLLVRRSYHSTLNV